MATAKICDVFNTAKNVKSYLVLVTEPGVAANTAAVIDRTIDLSPRGLERLKKFVERGITKPEATTDAT